MSNVNGKVNTTQTIKKVSGALETKIQATEANMDKLLAAAGCDADVKKVKTRIPLNVMNPDDDVLFIGLNGVNFYFRRGTSLNLAEPLVKLLENCGEL